MIQLQSRPAGPRVRRVPGGKPVAVLLGVVGLASTALTILLSAVFAPDEPNRPPALRKVVGSTVVLVATGLAVFLFSRWKTVRKARERV